jgi:hypothetical protein
MQKIFLGGIVLLGLLSACGGPGDAGGSGDGDGETESPGGDGEAEVATGGSGNSGGSSGSAAPTTDAATLGVSHTGQYHLGPVDFAETQWHNACAPGGGYRPELQPTVGLQGEYLAGVSGELSLSGGICDACLLIKTAAGKSIVARIVTYGVEQDPADIDVSPAVFEAIHQDEYPRTMTWSLAACPDAGTIEYEFQTEANEWWTSLWVRNARVPVAKVEVRSANHADFIELARGTDGTLTDADGFGQGAFTLRITGSDGQVIENDVEGFTPGAVVDSGEQFD